MKRLRWTVHRSGECLSVLADGLALALDETRVEFARRVSAGVKRRCVAEPSSSGAPACAVLIETRGYASRMLVAVRVGKRELVVRDQPPTPAEAAEALTESEQRLDLALAWASRLVVVRSPLARYGVYGRGEKKGEIKWPPRLPDASRRKMEQRHALWQAEHTRRSALVTAEQRLVANARAAIESMNPLASDSAAW